MNHGRIRNSAPEARWLKLWRRRDVLVSGVAVSVAASVDLFREAHGLETDRGPHTFQNDPEGVGMALRRIHEGKGEIWFKIFFNTDRPSKPAILLLYDIPPGASEGVHTHNVGDRKEGSFDEFYYVISGVGEMQIAGHVVPVKAGDHIFTPNGVPHGIENTSTADNLKVYLIAVIRD